MGLTNVWPKHLKGKKLGNEDSLRDLWDNIKCTNIHIIEVPEGEEREKAPEKYLKRL